MQEITKYRRRIIFFILVYFFLSITTYTATLSVSSQLVNPNDCAQLEFNITVNQDEDIGSLVVVFTFDPSKVQIGCDSAFNPSEGSQPYVFDSAQAYGNNSGMVPLSLNETFVSNRVPFKGAIHPRGIFGLAVWGIDGGVSTGPIFRVPVKILADVSPGQDIPIRLVSRQSSVFVQPNSDPMQDWVPMYCSVAKRNATPAIIELKSGVIRVVAEGTEGQVLEGDIHIPEGEQPIEGQQVEGEGEGMGESTQVEGTDSTQVEGVKEGDDNKDDDGCGCNIKQNGISLAGCCTSFLGTFVALSLVIWLLKLT